MSRGLIKVPIIELAPPWPSGHQQPGDVNPGYSHRRRSVGVMDTKNELCPARKEFGVLPTKAGICDLSDAAARQSAQINCVIPAISIGLKRDRFTCGFPDERRHAWRALGEQDFPRGLEAGRNVIESERRLAV
jgi:hypothetical protein